MLHTLSVRCKMNSVRNSVEILKHHEVTFGNVPNLYIYINKRLKSILLVLK